MHQAGGASQSGHSVSEGVFFFSDVACWPSLTWLIESGNQCGLIPSR